MTSQLNITIRALFTWLAFISTSVQAGSSHSNFGECRVLLTVSSLTKSHTDEFQTSSRDLAVAWEFPPNRCSSLQVDRIELIDNEPSQPHKTLWSMSTTETGNYFGHALTNVSIFPYGEGGGDTNGDVTDGVLHAPDLPCGWDAPPMMHSAVKSDADPKLGPCCIANYWAVAYSVKGDVLDLACVRIQPTWMSDHADSLAHLTLDQVFLPGTHNTGSYARYDYEQSTLWRFILTQDTRLWHQLVLGVRYLDIRIGYYPEPIGAAAEPGNPDKDFVFWVNHDLIRVQPFLPLLRELKAFLTVATKEVVILDLHRFPVGFESSNQSDPRATAHQKLLDLLQTELADMLAIAPPNTEGPLPPFSKYQNGSGRVLVFYGKKGFAADYPFVWPPLNQVWADARHPPALMAFLQDAMNKLPFKRQIWAAMAELTPTAYDVFFNFAGSLRKFAEEVNYDISSKLFFDWQFDANIVAVDYVMGSSVVEAAIVANRKRAISKEAAKEQLPTKIVLESDRPSVSGAGHKMTEADYFYYDEANTTNPTTVS